MKILIVAFDGLDYELIQEYNCNNLQQKDFGKIDNHTNIYEIKTSELFASFITGETHDVHGVRGILTWSRSSFISKIEKIITKMPFSSKTTGLRTAIWESLRSTNAHKGLYSREDWNYSTLFENIPNSKSLFVPSYSTSLPFRLNIQLLPLKYGYSLEDCEEYYEREFLYRKKELSQHLSSDQYSLLMCHFHKPDIWQHLYASNGVTHEEKIQQLYQEIDTLAAKIKERAEGKYGWILFMSDHGLPTEDAHNENAFYSSNIELALDNPHITDFHDLILEQVDTQENEFQDIDI